MSESVETTCSSEFLRAFWQGVLHSKNKVPIACISPSVYDNGLCLSIEEFECDTAQESGDGVKSPASNLLTLCTALFCPGSNVEHGI